MEITVRGIAADVPISETPLVMQRQLLNGFVALIPNLYFT
jgi:hypothetical protein